MIDRAARRSTFGSRF